MQVGGGWENLASIKAECGVTFAPRIENLRFQFLNMQVGVGWESLASIKAECRVTFAPRIENLRFQFLNMQVGVSWESLVSIKAECRVTFARVTLRCFLIVGILLKSIRRLLDIPFFHRRLKTELFQP